MKINQSRRRPIRKPHSPNQTQDSQGPDGKIRGTASQIFDKYMALARDATSSGDRVSAESFYQYADHYYRLMSPENENSSARHDTPRPTNSGPSPRSTMADAPFDDLPTGSDSSSSETARPPKSDREQRFDTRKSRHPYVSGSNRHHNGERSQNRAERPEVKVSAPSEPKATALTEVSPESSSEDVITVIQ